jgi:hypothetical protein
LAVVMQKKVGHPVDPLGRGSRRPWFYLRFADASAQPIRLEKRHR